MKWLVVGRLVLAVVEAVAEMERELIRERLMAGVAREPANDMTLFGPRQELPPDEHQLWSERLVALEAGYLNRTEAAPKLRVRRATLGAALRAVRNGGLLDPGPGDLGEGG